MLLILLNGADKPMVLTIAEKVIFLESKGATRGGEGEWEI